VLESVERAVSEMEAARANPRGKVVLGLPPSVGSLLTAPLVEHFRKSFPQVAMRVMEGFSGHVLEWLVTGKIDVAVLYNAPLTESLRAEPLLTDELYLLGPGAGGENLPGNSVEAEWLARLPLILPARPHGLRLLIDAALGRVGIVPRVELEVEAMPSTLGLVERSVGYTILSYATARPLTEVGRIRAWRIVQPVLARQLILAISSQRPTTPATRALANMVRDEIKSLDQQGLWRPKAS
jgi:LysR family nitrogen assimilation transcriptional regulator